MPLLKSKVGQLYRSLPRVPTTRFISAEELTSDILFSGYRPMVSPVRENPLNQVYGKEQRGDLLWDMKENKGNEIQEKEEIPFMAGPMGTGGILSGGVNGTWRYNPRIPNKLLQNALWSSSAMGMEYYPEWNEVPSKVCGELKPFQLEKSLERKNGVKEGSKAVEEYDVEKSVDEYEQVVQKYLQQWKQK